MVYYTFFYHFPKAGEIVNSMENCKIYIFHHFPFFEHRFAGFFGFLEVCGRAAAEKLQKISKKAKQWPEMVKMVKKKSKRPLKMSKMVKNEVLRMGWPMMENVCTSSDIVLVTSRGLQPPYRRKIKKSTFHTENQDFPYFSVYLRRHALLKWTLPAYRCLAHAKHR